MRVGIIGGKLQGVEAAYLALKAGWEVMLFDKHPDPPAKGLCHAFRRVDVTEEQGFIRACKGVEFLIPALENLEALTSLVRSADKLEIPVAYDPSAYAVSSSKIKSDELFSHLGLPMPLPWPGARFPLVGKPSGASGSAGVRRINSETEFQAFRSSAGDLSKWVVQEFLDGPSYSLEVIGSEDIYRTFQVTDLEMDPHYDCKRVLAPTTLDERQVQGLGHTSRILARALKLQGIMDVEVILHDGKLKVLEIDARLPSQTPTVVFLSTEVNMVEVLRDLYIGNTSVGNASMRSLPGGQSERSLVQSASPRGVLYEHIHVSRGRLEVSGEHVMSEAGPLYLHQDFFGADEAISNYEPHRPEWVATLMIVEETREQAWAKRTRVIEEIRNTCSIQTVLDPSPADTIENCIEHGA